MKIGIVTGIFPPDIGGPAGYVPRIARALSERGHQVKVLCLADETNPEKHQKYLFPVTRVRRGNIFPLRVLEVLFRAWRLALESDILYVNGLRVGATLGAVLTGTPVVHKVVGDFVWERARHYGWFKGTIDEYQRVKKGILLGALDWFYNLPLRRVGVVIVPSRYLGRIVAGMGVDPSRIVTIYNAVKPSNREIEHERTASIVTVCRLVSWKGVDSLIRILKGLPSAKLEIVGDGPLRGELQELVDALGLRDRVLFHGMLPEDSVNECLRRASVFVLNSTYEGLPHVVLEAIREGAPVIATRVGGTPEVVRHEETGLLVHAGDEEELSIAVRRLIEDRVLAMRLADNAKVLLARNFGYETMVAETESVIARQAGVNKV